MNNEIRVFCDAVKVVHIFQNPQLKINIAYITVLEGKNELK
jgi:hypothetical protein